MCIIIIMCVCVYVPSGVVQEEMSIGCAGTGRAGNSVH